MKKVEKKQKFKRLADSRVSKILNAIRLLENLSNKNFYSSTKIQRKKIFDTVYKRLSVCETRFEDNSDSRFKL